MFKILILGGISCIYGRNIVFLSDEPAEPLNLISD